jgi:hypothetical protein
VQLLEGVAVAVEVEERRDAQVVEFWSAGTGMLVVLGSTLQA